MSELKLVTYQSPQGARAGFVVGETIFDIAEITGRPAYAPCSTCCATGMRRAASCGTSPRRQGEASGKSGGHPLRGTRLLPPVASPGGIFCAGANFSDHMMEMAKVQNLKPEPDPHSLGLKPWHFVKATHCLAAPDSTVQASALFEEGRLGGGVDGGDRQARPATCRSRMRSLRRRLHGCQRSLGARFHQAAARRRQFAVQVRLARPKVLRGRLPARAPGSSRRTRSPTRRRSPSSSGSTTSSSRIPTPAR